MFELKLDLFDFERKAHQIGGAIDQVPFALSRSLNQAADNARTLLVQDTWPRSVTVRNRGFLRWALHIVYSTKTQLSVEINDERAQGRGHLALHAKGGTKRARNRLAIPPQGTVTRTSSGVRRSQRPAAIIAKTPKRALRITPRGIFVGVRGQGLTLKYLFRRSVEQPADVPFEDAFRDAIRRDAAASFPAEMKKAMLTRR